jgi:hypothetical protein
LDLDGSPKEVKLGVNICDISAASTPVDVEVTSVPTVTEDERLLPTA